MKNKIKIKKKKKRVPVPKKPPKVEKNPKTYDRSRYGNRGRSTSEAPVFLEGMKVLFDDRVGLYPVNLVEDKPDHESD